MKALLLLMAMNIIRERPIQFNEFINDLKLTAKQSTTIQQDIVKTYKGVFFGPSDGSNDIDIGDLRIYFDHSQQNMDIKRYKNGWYFKNVMVNFQDQTAHIEGISKVPGGLTAAQSMAFTNALLTELNVKQATLLDNKNVPYSGCNNALRQIPEIILLAFQGETTGAYEQFGYENSHQRHTAFYMQDLCNYVLPEKLELRDGSTLEFEGNQKLGAVMMDYWENDKCTFSKIYDALRKNGIFLDLLPVNSLERTKIFKENKKAPPMDLF